MQGLLRAEAGTKTWSIQVYKDICLEKEDTEQRHAENRDDHGGESK